MHTIKHTPGNGSAAACAIDPTSADQTVHRFGTPSAAAKYRGSLDGTAIHRREVACIMRGLRPVAPGGKVLDAPCGTGRLLPALVGAGYQVTAADASPSMLEHARELVASAALGIPDDRVIEANVFNLGFGNDSFDAVVCNRLIHHFREAPVRQAALRELARVCRGPLVVSFFCNRSFDGAWFALRDQMRAKKATDRIPISPRTFAIDAQAAGLHVVRFIQSRPCVSKQWYAVCERA